MGVDNDSVNVSSLIVKFLMITLLLLSKSNTLQYNDHPLGNI